MNDMPCLSCVNWERKQEGPIAWHHACKLNLPGFPNRGEGNCTEYSREPGSDDEDLI